jgi:3-oxoacyl-[acyl-carrier protein] reductase
LGRALSEFAERIGCGLVTNHELPENVSVAICLHLAAVDFLNDTMYQTDYGGIMETSLAGKLALVTGSSRGIGKAIALALAEQGADVVVNYRSNNSAAEQVVKQITSMGRKAAAVKADVSVPEESKRLLDEAKAKFAMPVSILVNNAGIAPQEPFDDIDEAKWDAVLDANLKSSFFVSRAFLPDMRKQKWGRIIFVSSVAASTGGIVGPHYSASKAAMIGLMHYFAKNFVTDGVTSNAVAPGLTYTEMAQGLESAIKNIPVGRMGTAEEIASVCILLATNGFMNGQTVTADGGVYFT